MKMIRNRKAFTIMEMLVVVAVMAMIATLATGAVMKSMRTMREKRINATISGLQMALNNYRAQQNEWPFKLSDMQRVNNSQTLYEVQGERNSVVFRKLFESDTTYIDPSSILTRIKGRRMSVREALEINQTDLPLGYPEPSDTSEFKFFSVQFNLATDSVKVSR